MSVLTISSVISEKFQRYKDNSTFKDKSDADLLEHFLDSFEIIRCIVGISHQSEERAKTSGAASTDPQEPTNSIPPGNPATVQQQQKVGDSVALRRRKTCIRRDRSLLSTVLPTAAKSTEPRIKLEPSSPSNNPHRLDQLQATSPVNRSAATSPLHPETAQYDFQTKSEPIDFECNNCSVRIHETENSTADEFAPLVEPLDDQEASILLSKFQQEQQADGSDTSVLVINSSTAEPSADGLEIENQNVENVKPPAAPSVDSPEINNQVNDEVSTEEVHQSQAPQSHEEDRQSDEHQVPEASVADSATNGSTADSSGEPVINRESDCSEKERQIIVVFPSSSPDYIGEPKKSIDKDRNEIVPARCSSPLSTDRHSKVKHNKTAMSDNLASSNRRISRPVSSGHEHRECSSSSSTVTSQSAKTDIDIAKAKSVIVSSNPPASCRGLIRYDELPVFKYDHSYCSCNKFGNNKDLKLKRKCLSPYAFPRNQYNSKTDRPILKKKKSPYFFCPVCFRRFPFKEDLQKHRETVSLSKCYKPIAYESRKVSKCKFCERKFFGDRLSAHEGICGFNSYQRKLKSTSFKFNEVLDLVGLKRKTSSITTMNPDSSDHAESLQITNSMSQTEQQKSQLMKKRQSDLFTQTCRTCNQKFCECLIVGAARKYRIATQNVANNRSKSVQDNDMANDSLNFPFPFDWDETSPSDHEKQQKATNIEPNQYYKSVRHPVPVEVDDHTALSKDNDQFHRTKLLSVNESESAISGTVKDFIAAPQNSENEKQKELDLASGETDEVLKNSSSHDNNDIVRSDVSSKVQSVVHDFGLITSNKPGLSRTRECLQDKEKERSNFPFPFDLNATDPPDRRKQHKAINIEPGYYKLKVNESESTISGTDKNLIEAPQYSDESEKLKEFNLSSGKSDEVLNNTLSSTCRDDNDIVTPVVSSRGRNNEKHDVVRDFGRIVSNESDVSSAVFLKRKWLPNQEKDGSNFPFPFDSNATDSPDHRKQPKQVLVDVHDCTALSRDTSDPLHRTKPLSVNESESGIGGTDKDVFAAPQNSDESEKQKELDISSGRTGEVMNNSLSSTSRDDNDIVTFDVSSKGRDNEKHGNVHEFEQINSNNPGVTRKRRCHKTVRDSENLMSELNDEEILNEVEASLSKFETDDEVDASDLALLEDFDSARLSFYPKQNSDENSGVIGEDTSTISSVSRHLAHEPELDPEYSLSSDDFRPGSINPMIFKIVW